ncbi:peptide chain release factor N(5)-glutamine methyltransferase [Urechidicola sp. KH5]
MTLFNLKQRYYNVLERLYPKSEIDGLFYISLKNILNKDRIHFALHQHDDISTEIIETFETVLKDLQNEIPIQYIFGKTEFFGLPFKVNQHTLIPRQETEELVAWILRDLETDPLLAPTILDIGTGSGCIPISLAKNIPNGNIKAIDISESALKVAKENALLNNVSIKFELKDILTNNLDSTYNVIISNPPYVRELEKEEIKNNVLDYEPHLALFVKDTNPLLFYERIADLALKHLSENGTLYFEINQYLGSETKNLLMSKGYSYVELRKDLLGNDRMLKAKK